LFGSELSERDLKMLSDTLQVFHKAMVNASVPYFLYKVNKTNKKDIVNDRCTVWTNRYKFYDTSGHEIKLQSWKAPFLDISFYKDNSTHLWDTTIKNQAPYNKSDIFPLTERPLFGHVYPAPRDPLRPATMVGTVPCSLLLDAIPFVQHVRGPAGAWCEEVLTHRGQVVSVFVRNSTDIPVC
ncbi:unnamed protein product, partial [Candidula unifasciata]